MPEDRKAISLELACDFLEVVSLLRLWLCGSLGKAAATTRGRTAVGDVCGADPVAVSWLSLPQVSGLYRWCAGPPASALGASSERCLDPVLAAVLATRPLQDAVAGLGSDGRKLADHFRRAARWIECNESCTKCGVEDCETRTYAYRAVVLLRSIPDQEALGTAPGTVSSPTLEATGRSLRLTFELTEEERGRFERNVRAQCFVEEMETATEVVEQEQRDDEGKEEAEKEEEKQRQEVKEETRCMQNDGRWKVKGSEEAWEEKEEQNEEAEEKDGDEEDEEEEKGEEEGRIKQCPGCRREIASALPSDRQLSRPLGVPRGQDGPTRRGRSCRGRQLFDFHPEWVHVVLEDGFDGFDVILPDKRLVCNELSTVDLDAIRIVAKLLGLQDTVATAPTMPMHEAGALRAGTEHTLRSESVDDKVVEKGALNSMARAIAALLCGPGLRPSEDLSGADTMPFEGLSSMMQRGGVVFFRNTSSLGADIVHPLGDASVAHETRSPRIPTASSPTLSHSRVAAVTSAEDSTACNAVARRSCIATSRLRWEPRLQPCIDGRQYLSDFYEEIHRFLNERLQQAAIRQPQHPSL
eukprot:TRINITY_DN34078_c0_g4_i1.p1 TRINITY_DN34078_c0_g4~~TRINITY_DN34078_c0_g4_i1.p1  ORF type:complete len:583 (+),score=120.12 TRINITY_DN34078_c0_g4_i1:84-1832(+)